MVNSQQLQIIIKAYEQFMRFGFKSVTVDEIARHAGISKKTLYENFEDKDTIVYSTLNWMEKNMHQEEEEIFASSQNAIEELIRIMQMLESRFKHMNPNCILDLQKYYPNSFKEWQCHQSIHENQIKKNLKRGVKEGYYRKTLDLNIIAFVRVESIMMSLKNPAANQFDFNKLQMQQMELFMYGISTLEGHELIEKYLTQLKKKK
jgi:TetR/AcrR family transcriptional regulator, cholesterol catabolism regulator